MTDQLYREIILEHWKHPQNYGVLDNATIDVIDSNPLCGDEIRLTVGIVGKKITAVAFVAKGCVISKASASVFTEEIKGKSVEEIREFTALDVLDLLGVSLTLTRKKCALLVYGILKKGINEY